jgi:hypothetical protein
MAAGEEGDSIYRLAATLLTAELSLSAGAEACPVAEGAVLGGHLGLANAGFDGPGDTAHDFSDEVAAAFPRRVMELLEAYSRGELCRQGGLTGARRRSYPQSVHSFSLKGGI